MPSDKLLNNQPEQDPKKVPDSLSWKKALEYEASIKEFRKIHEKYEAEAKKNPLSPEEKLKREQEIDEMIKTAEKELKEAKKNPEFRKQVKEMMKEHRELIKILEEIKNGLN